MPQDQFPEYIVYKNGTVWSHYNNKFLKPGKCHRGYLSVDLYSKKKSHIILVHRLVAQKFIPNPKNKLQVNHKNGVKDDNRVENLEWVTPSENQKHAFVTGLRPPMKGELHGRSKLKEIQVLEIRKLYATGKYYYRELAPIYNVDQSTIKFVVTRRTWKHI